LGSLARREKVVVPKLAKEERRLDKARIKNNNKKRNAQQATEQGQLFLCQVGCPITANLRGTINQGCQRMVDE
jgi:hypothetical protein